MSGPFSNPFSAGTSASPFGPTRKNTARQSQYGTELSPYIKEETQKADTEFSLWQPLEMVFDLLSRGQYVTANIAQDIASGRNPLEGAWKGITGERKGTWKTTLFGGQDRGSEAFGGLAPQGEDSALKQKFHIPIISDIFGDTSGEDVIGFVADVLLDPTTYITFGTSAANKAAGKSVAKIAVEMSARGLGDLNNLTKFTRKGFQNEVFSGLMTKSKEKAQKYLERFLDQKQIARFQEETYRSAYKKAIASTPELMQKELSDSLASGKADFLSGRGVQELEQMTSRQFREILDFVSNQDTFFKPLQGADKGLNQAMKKAGKPLLSSAEEEAVVKLAAGTMDPAAVKIMKEGLQKRGLTSMADDLARSPVEFISRHISGAKKATSAELEVLNALAKGTMDDMVSGAIYRGIKDNGWASEVLKPLMPTLDWQQFGKALRAGNQEAAQDLIRKSLNPTYFDTLKEMHRAKGGPLAVSSTNFAADDPLERLFQTSMSAGIDDVSRQKLSQGFASLADKYGMPIYKGNKAPLTDAISRAPQLENFFTELKNYSRDMTLAGGRKLTEEMAGLGTRSFSFLGKELFTWKGGPGIISQTWDKMMDGIKSTKVGKGISDALWSVLNTGPVGGLRKVFGWRNPYQQMLHTKERDIRIAQEVYQDEVAGEVHKIFEPHDDATKSAAFKILSEAEDTAVNKIEDLLYKDEKGVLTFNKDLAQRFGLATKEDADKALGLIKDVRAQMKKYSQIEHSYGIDYAKYNYYMPTYYKNQTKYTKNQPIATGPRVEKFQLEKQMDTKEFIDAEKRKLKGLFGMSDEEAQRMIVDFNWSTRSMDLEEMYIHRSLAHAQALANHKLIEEFKLFGIQLGGPQAQGHIAGDAFAKLQTGDLDPEAATKNRYLLDALNANPVRLQEIGLERGTDERLAGYWFDKDVAEIVNRALSVTGNDEQLNGLQKALSSFTSWWRGWAVATPGFHIRNAKSNMITLFLHKGPAAFSPDLGLDSWLATGYALYGDKFVEGVKKKFGFASDFVNTRLSKQFDNSGRTLADWANIAREKGIISKTSMAYDAEKSMAAYMGKKPHIGKRLNPMSNENIVFEKGRSIGSIVESIPKFTSMLLDMKAMSKQTGGNITDAMIDAAAENSRKYFFDYGDLSEVEKKVMKNIFPFYTWISKNIASQVRNLLDNRMRAQYALVAKAYNLTPEDTQDYENMPAYMREQMWINEGKTKDGKTQMLHPFGPWEDLNKLPFQIDNSGPLPQIKFSPKQSWDEIISIANPLLKTFAATSSGRDAFRRKDLEADAPAPRALRFLQQHPKVAEATDALLKAVGFSKGLGVTEGEKGEMRIDGTIAYLLETNFPLLTRIDQVGDGIATLLPGLNLSQKEVGGFKAGKTEAQSAFTALSTFLGVTKKEVDEAAEELTRYRAIYKEAEKRLREKRQSAPGYRKQLNEYMKREQKKLRKVGLVRSE